jgi:hypothetical protein
MSQLPEQILNPNLPMMMQMNPNLNRINPVPMAQPLQVPSNLPPNQNMGMQVPGVDHKSPQNQDTSN